MFKHILLGLSFILCVNCSAQAPSSHPIIAAYSQAYNDKDIKAIQAAMHPDIEWAAITGNEIEIHVSGKDALSKEMQSWFENPDLPKGSLRDWSINGNFVAVTETASWKTKTGGMKTQSALTVYELENNLIRRVYYYPALE